MSQLAPRCEPSGRDAIHHLTLRGEPLVRHPTSPFVAWASAPRRLHTAVVGHLYSLCHA